MLLLWKGLHESVSWYVISGKPVHMQTTLLHFLTEPHVMDADVTKSHLQLGGILDQQMKSLLIVTINHRLVSHVKGNCLEELYSAVQLFCSVHQGQELCLHTGCCYSLLFCQMPINSSAKQLEEVLLCTATSCNIIRKCCIMLRLRREQLDTYTRSAPPTSTQD